jgi:hypothetical protein
MPKKIPEFDPNLVRDISRHVYIQRLGAGEATKMVAKDKDDGVKLRKRAQVYDELTKCYLRVMEKLFGLCNMQR